jgi:high-affinity iron transporter
MDGVVAGVPELADFDVSIDAGGDASDPENAVSFSIKTPAGKTFKQPGNFNFLVETSLVGQTVRTMQGTGWIGITSLDSEMPYWLGLWFGVYPTWQTIGAQVAASAFVIGSFFLAKELQVNRPRRRALATTRRSSSDSGDALRPEPS